jgi:hypothetical protein
MSVAPLQFLLLVFAGWVNAASARLSSISRRRTASCASSSATGVCASPTLSVAGSRPRAKPSAAAPKQLAGLVTPDTILRWYRELVAKKYDGPPPDEDAGDPVRSLCCNA